MRHFLTRVVPRLWAVAIVVALVCWPLHLQMVSKYTAILVGIITLVPIGIWFIVFVWKAAGWGFDEAMLGAQAIPSPQETSASLQQEWGRPPTVQEVAAVQQILVNQRNQHLTNAGLTFGALYLMHDAAHRMQGR